MTNYTEQDFEEHIEEHLLNSNCIKVDPTAYDKNLCLIPSEVIPFIKSTQLEEYKALQTQYGDQTDLKLCQRLSNEIGKAKQGTLHILRKGFIDRGSKFKMAYYKPESGMNPGHRKLYESNRFAIVRQLKYSNRNENSIDIVIFLNGIPVLTMELKNSLTGQFVSEAVKQYKQDRDPREPLLAFKRCLVHFAVGNEKVYMTTRLMGDKTRFLPFNLDTENPVNPKGHKTAYLWEDILQPDTLLDLINNYLHIQINTEKIYDKSKGLIEKESTAMIFPRFHQLDVVRKLLKEVKRDGVGHNYLIQHSAGSGKSNSIAWLAHQLASLYQYEGDKERLFDSIIVVTDRRILDRQLQNTIKQFEQTVGVVKPIEKNSAELKDSLQAGKDIIITTIQKFPVISKSMNELKGKRFAVFVDEAHSSQSGETAKHLKQTLSVRLEDAEKEDANTFFDVEDALLKEIENSGKQEHISYFAFTATPKNKTLELFGRKIYPNKPPVAFHYYTMRQAIEEEFILDVLDNYTTYKRYFKLMKTLKDDKAYEKSKAARLLTNYVDLQPHAIDTKVKIMLDHFLRITVNAIQGKGRAMVVTRSRPHALKYYLAFCRIMKEQGLEFKPLVAFSGTVKDDDTGESYTESINGLPPKVSIADALKTPEYRILIVANKFQTGFDEPLLHTMYVDKKLGGVQAVQTLSRLNRTKSGKNKTVVLDFVNEPEDIKKAFQPYYQKTILEEEADPNKLHDIQGELEQFEVYREQDINEFASIFLNPDKDDELVQPILDQCVVVWREKDEEEREDFRSKLQSYIRLYGYLSQIITFKSTALEALYIFAKALNRKLDRRESHLPTEILNAVDLDSFRIQKMYEDSIKLKKTDEEVKGIKAETGRSLKEPEQETLSEIIKRLNKTYGMGLTEDDKVDLQRIKEKVDKDENLHHFMTANNTTANKKKKFDEMIDNMVLDFVHTKLDLYQKLTKEDANKMLKDMWFDAYQKEMKEQEHGNTIRQ